MPGVPSPKAPDVSVSWLGASQQPWHDLDFMLQAAEEVIATEYPNNLDYKPFALEVYGANDLMVGDTIPSGIILDKDGKKHLLMGTTDRTCSVFLGLQCWYRIRIRQTLAKEDFPDPKETHFPHFSGPLRDVNASALAYEIANRMIAAKTGHWPGGPGAPWDALANKITARYTKLVSTSTKAKGVP